MQLRTRPIEVSDWDDNKVPALLQECECGSVKFMIYAVQIDGKSHPHMQCTACGESYCDGSCGGPPGPVDAASYEITSFKCPKCGRVSHNPNDRKHGYCGACHEFTGTSSNAFHPPIDNG